MAGGCMRFGSCRVTGSSGVESTLRLCSDKKATGTDSIAVGSTVSSSGSLADSPALGAEEYDAGLSRLEAVSSTKKESSLVCCSVDTASAETGALRSECGSGSLGLASGEAREATVESSDRK